MLITQREKDKFWKRKRTTETYNAVKSGMSLEDTAVTLNITLDDVLDIVNDVVFKDRLEKYLNAKTYLHQVTRVSATEELGKKLWHKVRSEMADVPAEICLKEFTKLMANKEIIKLDPQLCKTVMDKDMTEEERLTAAREFGNKLIEADDIDFGYQPLPDSVEEEKC